jgi:hypothetical protein
MMMGMICRCYGCTKVLGRVFSFSFCGALFYTISLGLICFVTLLAFAHCCWADILSILDMYFVLVVVFCFVGKQTEVR